MGAHSQEAKRVYFQDHDCGHTSRRGRYTGKKNYGKPEKREIFHGKLDTDPL